jgi:hypothetical protein
MQAGIDTLQRVYLGVNTGQDIRCRPLIRAHVEPSLSAPFGLLRVTVFSVSLLALPIATCLQLEPLRARDPTCLVYPSCSPRLIVSHGGVGTAFSCSLQG